VCNACRGSALWRDELKQLALRVPIQRHLGLATTDSVQVEMPRLAALEDRQDDVGVLPLTEN